MTVNEINCVDKSVPFDTKHVGRKVLNDIYNAYYCIETVHKNISRTDENSMLTK